MNVEPIALTDARYNALGKLLGSNRHEALGRMVVVWNECQERESYILKVENLNSLFTDCENLAELLLKCGLGKPNRHGVYICGTRGRIEWLRNKRRTGRENGKRGGRPKKTSSEPIKNQDRLRVETPLAPALALTENQKTSRPTRSARTFTDDSREMKAARYLFGKIQTNNANAKEPNLQAWARDFDLIFRVDKRDPADVRKVVDWSQSDPFWLKNVLSPSTLRKQYDRLALAANGSTTEKFDRTRPVV